MAEARGVLFFDCSEGGSQLLLDDIHACTAWQPLAGPLLGPHQAVTHAACFHFNRPAPQQQGEVHERHAPDSQQTIPVTSIPSRPGP